MASATTDSPSQPADTPTPSVLANRDVLLYLAARFLWMAAFQICNVAIGWLVYEETRSAWALGLVGLAAFAPKLIVAFVSGIIADRYDRRRIVATCLVINAVTTAGLLAAVLSEPVFLPAVYALFMLSATARGFANPAIAALAANLVPREQLSRVFSLSFSISQCATILGPALGGLIYLAGAYAPFAAAAVFFLLASIAILLIRHRSEARSKAPVTMDDVFAGLAFIWRRPTILGAVSLDMFAVLLGGVTALLPMVAYEILHVGPVGLGVLRSMPALGAVVLGLFLAWYPIRRRAGHQLFVAIVVFGLATIGVGLSENLILTMGFLWVLGAADVFSVVIRQTLVQGDTPDEMRGRVSAVNSLFIGASNELGEFESGATAALFGLVPAILIGGVGTITIAILWALMFPSLRKRDRLVESHLV